MARLTPFCKASSGNDTGMLSFRARRSSSITYARRPTRRSSITCSCDSTGITSLKCSCARKGLWVPADLPGSAGAWDENGVFWPSVVCEDDGYRLYYGGQNALGTAIGFSTSPDGWVMIYQSGPVEMRGLALSDDGVHWQTYPSNPVFTKASFPIPNAKTWDANLLYQDGVYYYFMELGTLNGTDLYLTTHQ